MSLLNVRVCEAVTLCMDAPRPEESASGKSLSLVPFMKCKDHAMNLNLRHRDKLGSSIFMAVTIYLVNRKCFFLRELLPVGITGKSCGRNDYPRS